MGIFRSVHAAPVEEASFSPDRAHTTTWLAERFPGVIPVIHTPYDYYKGNS